MVKLQIYIYTCAAVFGACIGSFLNVVVYRLPKGKFFANARSVCPACEHTLSWRDLIPVASYLALRGKCRHCGERISPRYPLVELATAALAVASLARFVTFNSQFATLHFLQSFTAFAVCAILLCIALTDADTMEIPTALLIALVPFAVGAVWVWGEVPVLERGIGLFAISVPMFLLALAVKGAFGEGDMILIAVCGFLLGWKCVLLAMFLAIMAGGGYAAALLFTGKGKRRQQIAFGPYLCVGIAVSLFFGDAMIGWYLGLFGL